MSSQPSSAASSSGAIARPAGPPAAFELTRREKVFTIVGTLLGLLLAALDQTIVATAGPAMQRDLQIAPSLYPWITTAYLVASTVMVPVYGKLSDLFGRKPILLVGIVLFLIGSLACGLSPTTMTLLASRALQGIGSAALFTTAFAVVADIFPPAERGRYQGIFGGAFALSSVVGPLLGGFLTDHLSWHWVFLVNLPLGAIAITFIVTRMPTLRRAVTERRPIDWLGAVWLTVAVVPFLVALSLGRAAGESGETRAVVGALLAVAVVGVVGFLRTERRAPEPILDLALFRNRTFALGNLATFIFGGTFLGAIVFLPLFMVNVVGVSATAAGFTMVPLTFGIVGGNIASGQIVARLGRYRGLMLLANLVLLSGFALLAFTLRPDSSEGEVTLKMVAMGLGLGPTIPLYTLAIQNAVEPRFIGVATAAATFFRQIGSTIGVTLLGVAFAFTLVSGMQRIERPAILEGLAPAARQEASTLGEGGEGGETVQLHVDVAGYRKAIEARWPAEPAKRAEALAAVDTLDRDTKAAFTHAVSTIYRWGMLIALIGLLCTVRLPEIPLRKTHDMPVASPE